MCTLAMGNVQQFRGDKMTLRFQSAFIMPRRSHQIYPSHGHREACWRDVTLESADESTLIVADIAQ